MAAQPFVFHKTVYLSDTNAEGNVYFSHFFEWQGQTREAYLNSGLTDKEWQGLVAAQTRLITAKAWLDYRHEALLFDDLEILMGTQDIKHASLQLAFRFQNKRTGELLAEGGQMLAFKDASGKLIPIPPPILRLARQIEEAARVEPTRAARQLVS